MENTPVTIWQPTTGNGEFTLGGVFNIADPSGFLLADPSGVEIVDTGVIFTQIPSTIWEQDESL